MLENRFWTKKGLTTLGLLIRKCRESHQMPLRDAAELIASKSGVSISYRTLASVENASSEPKHNTLVAIACAGFVKKNGIALNMQDFDLIASETYASNINCLAELIENYLTRHNITLEQFSEICGVTVEDLKAITQGRETADYEGDLIFLARHLYNPDTGTNFNNHPEMMEYCLRRNSGEEETHTNIKPRLLY